MFVVVFEVFYSNVVDVMLCVVCGMFVGVGSLCDLN